MIISMAAVTAFAGELDMCPDTLNIDGKAVVFFESSQAEYNATTNKEKKAFNEDLYDFFHNQAKVSGFLESNEI